jgi:DNA-binding CsgD family transcriptional regulator/uncharacterized membrane protein
MLGLVCGIAAPDASGVMRIVPDRLCGIVACALALVVGWIWSDAFERCRRVGSIVTAFSGAVAFWIEQALVSFGLATPVVEGVLFTVAGASVGLFMTLLGSELCRSERHEILQVCAAVFFGAGVFFAFGNVADLQMRYGICCAYLLMSLVFGASATRGRATEPFIARDVSAQALRLDWRSSLSYAITGMAFGVVAVGAMLQMPGPDAAKSIALGYAVAAVLSWFISRVKGASWVLLGPVERWTFPVIIACLLGIMFTGKGSFGFETAIAILCVVLSLRDIARAVNRSLLASEYTVQRAYLYARATMPMVCGLAAGTIVGSLVGGVGGQQSDVLAAACMVVLFSIAISLVPYGADPLVMPLASPEKSDEGAKDDGEKAQGPGYWRRACDGISAECGLTPREDEVFRLLARGRTAKFIARDLNISVYTAKSHMYNIYHKLGCDSQQELIDIVVARDADVSRRAHEPRERLSA